jgi:hypothetical protein
MSLYFVIAGIAAVLGFLVWLWVKAASSGAAAAKEDILTTKTEAQEKQLQAAANAPKDKADVLKRLREKGL